MSYSKHTLMKLTFFLACMLGSSASTMVPNRNAHTGATLINLSHVFDAIPDGYVSRGIKLKNKEIAIMFSPLKNPTQTITYKVNQSNLDPKKLQHDIVEYLVAQNLITTRQPLRNITNIQEEELVAITALASLKEYAQIAKK